MRKAMECAIVGDDVFSEDPQINGLEEHLAKLFDKESALFCTSGTLANQLGLRSLLSFSNGSPYSIICDSRSHVVKWEASALENLCGATSIQVSVEQSFLDGKRKSPHFEEQDIQNHAVLDEEDYHLSPTRVVSLENTCNGTIIPLPELLKISKTARKLGLSIHMDGARILNAATFENQSLKSYADCCDSITVCLSKGLGAPVGSVLLSTKKIINKARHLRKMYGGGWRQAGMLAAAASYAMNNNFPDALVRSHELAQTLNAGMTRLGVTTMNPVQTNILLADFKPFGVTANDIMKGAAGVGVKVFGGNSPIMRLVTHFQLQTDAVERLLYAIEQVIRKRQG
jgi:threonine aldolase